MVLVLSPPKATICCVLLSGSYKLAQNPGNGQRLFSETPHIFCVDHLARHKVYAMSTIHPHRCALASPPAYRENHRRRASYPQTVRNRLNSGLWVAACRAALQAEHGQIAPTTRKMPASPQSRPTWLRRGASGDSQVGEEKVVGAARFELTAFCTQNRRATRLRYAPTRTAY